MKDLTTFWQDIYQAAIEAGCGSQGARDIARYAVEDMALIECNAHTIVEELRKAENGLKYQAGKKTLRKKRPIG